MGTFLFTNILLLKEKKHGRAKSCSPMPKGSRHSSQRVPTLSGKYVSFSSTLHSCLPSLPTAPFFFIFSLIQSSHPRKSGHHLAWRALSAFHYDTCVPTPSTPLQLLPFTLGHRSLPGRANLAEWLHASLSQSTSNHKK